MQSDYVLSGTRNEFTARTKKPNTLPKKSARTFYAASLSPFLRSSPSGNRNNTGALAVVAQGKNDHPIGDAETTSNNKIDKRRSPERRRQGVEEAAPRRWSVKRKRSPRDLVFNPEILVQLGFPERQPDPLQQPQLVSPPQQLSSPQQQSPAVSKGSSTTSQQPQQPDAFKGCNIPPEGPPSISSQQQRQHAFSQPAVSQGNSTTVQQTSSQQKRQADILQQVGVAGGSSFEVAADFDNSPFAEMLSAEQLGNPASPVAPRRQSGHEHRTPYYGGKTPSLTANSPAHQNGMADTLSLNQQWSQMQATMQSVVQCRDALIAENASLKEELRLAQTKLAQHLAREGSLLSAVKQCVHDYELQQAQGVHELSSVPIHSGQQGGL